MKWEKDRKKEQNYLAGMQCLMPLIWFVQSFSSYFSYTYLLNTMILYFYFKTLYITDLLLLSNYITIHPCYPTPATKAISIKSFQVYFSCLTKLLLGLWLHTFLHLYPSESEEVFSFLSITSLSTNAASTLIFEIHKVISIIK